MGKFKLEDYEPVEDRLKRFWADHPDWAVLTTLESDVSDIKEVIYKSSLVDEKGHIRATGWAHETQGEGFVNTTSHIENCETSAIGRALANLGYQGSKRPSREEMEKVERQNKATEEGKQAQANIQGKDSTTARSGTSQGKPDTKHTEDKAAFDHAQADTDRGVEKVKESDEYDQCIHALQASHMTGEVYAVEMDFLEHNKNNVTLLKARLDYLKTKVKTGEQKDIEKNLEQQEIF